MSKHPIDHDRKRDDAKVAKEYARIEREQGEELSDPKVQKMTRARAGDEATDSRMRAYLKIDREKE